MQNYLMKYFSSCALIFLPNLHLKRPLSVRIVQLRQLNDKNITTLVAYALDVNLRPTKRKQLEKSIVNGPNTWWIFTRQAATKAVQHNYADADTSTSSLFLLDLIPSSAKMNTKKFWHDFRHRRQCWLWCPCNEVYGRRLETAKGTWKSVTALHRIASNPSIC